MDRTQNAPKLNHPRCPYCHEGVSPQEDKEPCRACMAWHHRACWEERKGACAACGRGAEPRVAATPKQQAVEPAERTYQEPLGIFSAGVVIAISLISLLGAVYGVIELLRMIYAG